MTNADLAVLIAKVEGKLDNVIREVGEVKTQTTLTNGRVNKLESWRDRLAGIWFAMLVGGGIIGFIVTSLIMIFFQKT